MNSEGCTCTERVDLFCPVHGLESPEPEERIIGGGRSARSTHPGGTSYGHHLPHLERIIGMDPRVREPDPETMAILAKLADNKRRLKVLMDITREDMTNMVRLAKKQGHSYAQIQKATGLSLGAVQRMVK